MKNGSLPEEENQQTGFNQEENKQNLTSQLIAELNKEVETKQHLLQSIRSIGATIYFYKKINALKNQIEKTYPYQKKNLEHFLSLIQKSNIPRIENLPKDSYQVVQTIAQYLLSLNKAEPNFQNILSSLAQSAQNILTFIDTQNRKLITDIHRTLNQECETLYNICDQNSRIKINQIINELGRLGINITQLTNNAAIFHSIHTIPYQNF